VENWEDVTMTYLSDNETWTAVVINELVQFSGTLFSVLNELDEYFGNQSTNSNT
jgi:hypothetical protein